MISRFLVAALFSVIVSATASAATPTTTEVIGEFTAETLVPLTWGETQQSFYCHVEEMVTKSEPGDISQRFEYFSTSWWLDKFGRVLAEPLEVLERRLNKLPLCRYCPKETGKRHHKVFPRGDAFVVVHGDEKRGELIGSMRYTITRQAPFFRADLGESGMPSDEWRKAHGLPPNKNE